MVNFRITIFWVVVCVTASEAFWWGVREPPAEPQSQWPAAPAVYYQQRLMKTHPMPLPGSIPPQEPITVPAIPIQVPLQAQFAPASRVHNVQLVPCLCPIQPEEHNDQSSSGQKEV